MDATVADPVSAGGRKKAESRQPLDFTLVQQIDRFGLIRELARGGMGQVFLARDTKLGRKVAIKFLLHDDPNFVGRFLVEARATARCTHENIVTIFEVGEHEGLPYMVLEYLEGKTLSQLLEQKMTPRGFAELMVPVARALERAHEHGIVHRDLKPSNIFVTDRGVVKVLDFGVAKCFDAPAEQLRSAAATSLMEVPDAADGATYMTFSGDGSLVGTIPYMSPEQWGVGEVDHASDLWALGIMFWRALTGVHPAGTMSPEKLRERLTNLDSPLPDIRTRAPEVPAELAAIINKCLAKPRAQRYQSATDLLTDLQAFLAPHAVRNEECPFRGLAAFGEGDARFFFGRSAEIRTALGLLEKWPLLAVIGPSGVGKSSFVHAGLVPAIRGTPGNWQVRVLRPGRNPIASLAAALDPEYPSLTTQVCGQLHESPGALGEALRREAAYRNHRLLLIVDQLEELFTLSDDEGARSAFLAALLAAADDPSAPVRVVLSMRADFLDRLAGHKQFLAELSRGLFFLSAPDQENLRETLVRPAELAGFAFEPQIVDDMLRTATNRGALPLLQFAATKLWDARDRRRRVLTRSSYDAMGGVGGAFVRHADEVAAAVPAQNQGLLRAIMTRLVTPEGTRAVVDANELVTLSGERDDVQRILDHLVRARLIHLHTDPSVGVTVELVHEVLITEWPTLSRWLEDNQALRGLTHELRTAAKQWIARGKPADLVWRGATANEALALASRHVLELAAAEREFLDAVRSQASRSRRRKFLVVTTIMTMLGLVLAGGTIAYIRVSAAEKDATRAAVAAEAEAAKAREAEAQVKSQLDEVNRAKVATREAQATIEKAGKDVEQSREQLQAALVESRANEKLARENEIKAKENEIKAREAAAMATKATEIAKKLAEEAKQSKEKAERLLAAEQKRVQELEKNKAGIVTGKLKQ